ncbi:MAG: hypothetical protein EXS30_04710 [Pedosphaera sp.]|nr:hypothetical protein [Pedosphaera sp.]
MSLTKTKRILVGIILSAAIVTPCVLHFQMKTRLSSEIEVLRQQNLDLTRLSEQSQRERKLEAQEFDGLRQEHKELVRLRGQVALLRARETELAQVQAENRQLKSDAKKAPVAPEPPKVSALNPSRQPAEAWANVGFATPAAAFQTLSWAMSHRDTNVLASGLIWADDQNRAKAEAAFAAAPDSFRGLHGSLEGFIYSFMMEAPNPAGVRIVSQVDRRDMSMIVVEKDFANGAVKPDKVQLQREGEGYRQVIAPGLVERMIQSELSKPTNGR